MTRKVSHRPILPRYSAPRVPLEVLRSLNAFVESRDDISEAHLVTVWHTENRPETPTLIVVTDDSYLATVLMRALQTHLSADTRPELLLLGPSDPNLDTIRTLGGELKRGPSGLQWLLLLGP